jgi:ABC-2 type transport system ATP-binding protein
MAAAVPVTTAVPAIAVEGLVKRYGSRAVVDGVSLDVHPGELVALLGPNGAGKTTTVEIIEGYRTADAGSVRVLGVDPGTGGRALRSRVGLMLQAGGFDMRTRPLETIRQYARFHAEPRDPDELLDRVGLRTVARTPYRRLSGGERQRLGLAVALVGRPEVLILDEPTAGMDPEARASVRALIGELRADGLAILLTSHDLVDVERLADRIVILVDGRVAASGTPAGLASGLRPRLRFRLDRPLDSAGLADVSRAAAAPVQELEPGRYELAEVIPTPAVVAAIAVACAAQDRLIVESRTVGGSLEDAYLELVGAAGDIGSTT